jgi:hypothetical protein
LDFRRFSRFVHGDFGGCILQPEIELWGGLDAGTKREQSRRSASVQMIRVGMHAMRDVMHKRIGAMQKCYVCYMMHYAMYAMRDRVQIQDGQAGRRKLSWYALCNYWQETGKYAQTE